MTRDQVRTINRERLTRWMKKLTDLHGTPALLVGIGHDHVSGQIQVLCVEDLDQEKIAGFLHFALAELAAESQGTRLGATGAYPAGVDPRHPDTDQGELCVGVAADPATGRVRMEFGKPVAWLSMTAAEAIRWGEAMIAKGRQLTNSKGEIHDHPHP